MHLCFAQSFETNNQKAIFFCFDYLIHAFYNCRVLNILQESFTVWDIIANAVKGKVEF